MKGYESMEFVNGLYSAGAVMVTAIDLEIEANVEGTSTLIVELPTNPAARKEVFKIEAKIAKERPCDPTPDRGQKYSCSTVTRYVFGNRKGKNNERRVLHCAER